MLSSVELEEQSLYKCHFCDIIFTSFASIVKHKSLYCARRNKLPRSATVTSARALDDLSTSEKSPRKELTDGHSSELDVVGVSEESSGGSDVSQTSENLMTMSVEDVVKYLRKKLGTIHSSITVSPLTEAKPRAKRKMAEAKQESKEGSSSTEDNQKSQKSLKQN